MTVRYGPLRQRFALPPPHRCATGWMFLSSSPSNETRGSLDLTRGLPCLFDVEQEEGGSRVKPGMTNVGDVSSPPQKPPPTFKKNAVLHYPAVRPSTRFFQYVDETIAARLAGADRHGRGTSAGDDNRRPHKAELS